MAPTALPNINTTMTHHQTKNAKLTEPLTWQQLEDLDKNKQPKRRRRGRKAPKFVPFDPEAVTTQPEDTATASISNVQQPEGKVHNTQRKAGGKARTRVPPHCSKQAAPTNIPQGHFTVSEKPRVNPKNQKPCRELKTEVMATKPSLPPHLRKRAAALAVAKTDVKLGDSIGIGSPPASMKSQAEEPDQTQNPLETHHEVVTQDHTPPSPPTTIEEPPKPVKLVKDWNGWDEPVPHQPDAPSRRNENPRWPRPPKAPKEKHVWLKQREIPRDLSPGSQSDGGVTFKSDSEGDPSYDVKKLMCWNGDWLPPPEEWAARKGFTNRHFSQVIEKWANGHSRNCTKLMNIDTSAFSGERQGDGTWLNKDLVPRYWLHETIDNAAPRKFWEELPQRAPAPLTDIDIMEDPPYWERWDDDQPGNCFMTTLCVPEARIDLNDADNELESPFAMLCTTDRLARIMDIKECKERRARARRNRPIPASVHEVPQTPDRRFKPKANIYLRPVQPSDVRGVTTIYNHYVNSTIHAPEFEERSEENIRTRVDDTIQAGLPFLVAIAKRNQRKSLHGYVTETIVGFAYLIDYFDQSSMYRYTFDLELYVHPGYIRQGIGKCLLDQMIYIANTGYSAKGGYEWVNEFEYLKNGKSRVVKTILTTLYYERGDDVEWATGYLGEFGFKKAGRFAQIGHKVGKVVDKVMFQLQTTENIDPKSIPMVQD